MAILPVISATIPGSSSGGTSDPVDTTGANLLVVSGSYFINVIVISDSFNNTWVPAITEEQNLFGLVIYYCLNPTVGAGHTITINGEFTAGAMEAFSGVDSIGDTVGENDGTGSSVQPGSLTPAGNGSLLVAAITNNGEPTDESVAIDSGFTLTSQQPFSSGEFFGSAMGYLIQDTAAAVNPTFSWTGDATAVNAAMVVFLPKANNKPSRFSNFLNNFTFRF